MYKVFHTLVPRGGIHQTTADAARFASAWDRFAVTVANVARQSDDFRFYTRTPGTGTRAAAQSGNNIFYEYQAAETVAFETLASAITFRDAVRALKTDFLDPVSAWLVTLEHVGINGAPKGPLDTGRGIKVITSMKRRPGIDPIQFRAHWEEGARYVSATQGISRYTTNAIVDAEYGIAEPPVDGFVEVWFRTIEDMQVCFRDPLMTGVHQDHNDLFIDRRTFFTIQCGNAEQWVSGSRAEGLREW